MGSHGYESSRTSQKTGQTIVISDFEDRLDFVVGNPSALRKRIVVFFFFATWCQRSRQSVQDLNDLYKTYHSKGIEFIGITAEAVTTVRAFLNRAGKRFDFPCAVNQGGSLARTLKARVTPQVHVVSEGTVTWIGDAHDGLEKALDSALFENKMRDRETKKKQS